MKKIILVFVSFLLYAYTYGQETYSQLDSATLKATPLISIEKGKLLKDVHMIANMRFASNNSFQNSSFASSQFQMNELRMEIVGKVADRINFRFRDVYMGRSTDAQTTDQLRHSIDIAFIDVAVSPQVSVAAGKLPADWGSYEFDINPVFMYAYNDLVQYGEHFLSGAQARWKALPDHTFTVQVLNSRNRSFDYLYGQNETLQASKAPLGTLVNWRGSFFENKFNTLWSYSFFNEAKNRNVQYLALGNQLKLPKLTVQYDFKYSNEGLDRTGAVSRLIPNSAYEYAAQDTRYIEHWVRGEYFFAPKWSATLIGMVNSNYWRGNSLAEIDVPKDNLLRTAWSFTAALEYHIYKPYNVKVFAAYVGRYNNYSDYAKSKFDLANDNNGVLMLGILSPLVLF